MKKYSRLVCLLLCSCILLSGVPIKAVELSTFEEIKTAYQEKDTSYKRSILNLRQQVLKYDVAEESLAQGIEKGLGEAQIAELELQKDLLSFYKQNEQRLLGQIKDNSDYQLKKQLFQLKLLKEQQKYYGIYGEYLNILYKIEDVKYKRGRSTKEELNNINAQIVKNSADLGGAVSDYQDGQEKIGLKDTVDNYINQLTFEITPKQRTITVDELAYKIKRNNGDYAQLENAAAGYENYIRHFAADTSNLSYRQGMLQLSDNYLQLLQSEENIISYAKKIIGGYKKTLNKQSASALNLAVLSKKRINAQKQYEKGRATLLACYEARVKEEAERQNYFSLCHQLILWEEILGKGIYDNTI